MVILKDECSNWITFNFLLRWAFFVCPKASAFENFLRVFQQQGNDPLLILVNLAKQPYA